jgi:hypothetical protein
MEKQVGKEWAWRKDIGKLTPEQIEMFEKMEHDYKSGEYLKMFKEPKSRKGIQYKSWFPVVLAYISIVLALISILYD